MRVSAFSQYARTGVQNVGLDDGGSARSSHMESSNAATETATPSGANVIWADEVLAWVALPEIWSARVCSSVRMQSVFAVISLGQTTRLKFALWNVRGIMRSVEMKTYLGYEASCSQSKRHSQAGCKTSGRVWQSSFVATPALSWPKTDCETEYCVAHPSAEVVFPPGIWERSASLFKTVSQ